MVLVRIAVCAVLLGACKFAEVPLLEEDAPGTDGPSPDGPIVDAPDPTHTVGGSVAGLWTGAAVVLEIDAPPAAVERITVDVNGTFTFPSGLSAGSSFTLSVPANGQPFMHICVVGNPNGMVVDADVTDRQVTCIPQVSMNVAFSAPVEVTFDVATPTYTAETAHGVQESRLIVSVPGGASATVNGSPAISGQPSAVVSLGSPITVHVVLGAMSQNFVFTFDRSGPTFGGPMYAKSSNSGAMDRQGVVSASGNLVAVGAPLEDGVGETSADSGAVYIYRRTGLTWTQDAYLKPATVQAGAHFGASVSLHNEGRTAVLAVGAPLHDGAQVDCGATYVFRRSAAGGWTEEQRLDAAAATAGDQFGDSVSLNDIASGGYAVAIGAPRYGTDHGAVYVFRNSGTLWSQEDTFTSPNPDANDTFGVRVSMYDDVLAVGAPSEDSAGSGVNSATQADNAAPGSGAAYIYRRNGADWVPEAYVKASNTGAGDQFGASVSIEGNVLVVGAPREDSDGVSQSSNSASDSGAAYVFERVGGTWSQVNFFKSGGTTAGMTFGHDVDVHGDMILVGAPELAGAQDATGAVRYFVRGASGFGSGSALIRGVNGEQQDEYGSFVSLSGEGFFVGALAEDSNARGFNSGLADNSAPDSGAVYGYY